MPRRASNARDGLNHASGPGDDDVGAHALDAVHVWQRGEVSRARWAIDGRNRRVCSGSAMLTTPAGVSRAITPTGREHRDAVGEALGLLHQVRDQQDGDATVADARDELPGLAARLRVEARRELVEDRHARSADEREGDREPLLLAARQIPVGRPAHGVETEVRDELIEGRRDPCRTRRTATGPRATVSRSGSSLSWSWTPTTERSRAQSRPGSSPRTRTVPASGSRRPAIVSTVVVFPAPFGPGCRRSRPPRRRTRCRRRRGGRQ